MKFPWHYLWYGATIVGFAGLFLGWNWVDPWFPMFTVAMAQLSRIRSGHPETIFDKTFKSGRLEKLAAGSILLMMIVITGWFLYLKYVSFPANDRAGVEEYLKEREKLLEQEHTK